ncbi:MAG: helix-turn-helix domain-containing protein [Blautia sp.]|nr:helix-turn-helix domain-containing protein [Blautia sp.]
MIYSVKELRLSTGLTQKAFAEQYQIPLSTLRKWEQGEASPAPYVLSLLARTLPSAEASWKPIHGKNGKNYYYDPLQHMVSDDRGNHILITEDLKDVKAANLLLYLEDLFSDFYRIQERFNRDCYYDKTEDIIWSRKET